MWLFYCCENFEKIFWVKFYCGQGLIRATKKTSLREDRLLQRISLLNRKLNSMQILKQRTLISNVSVWLRTVWGRLMEIGLQGCKVCAKPLLTEFQRKRRWRGQGNIHYGLLKTGIRSYLVMRFRFVFLVTKIVPI